MVDEGQKVNSSVVIQIRRGFRADLISYFLGGTDVSRLLDLRSQTCARKGLPWSPKTTLTLVSKK